MAIYYYSMRHIQIAKNINLLVLQEMHQRLYVIERNAYHGLKMFIRFHSTSKIQISYHVAQKLENLMRLKKIKENFIRHFKHTNNVDILGGCN